MKVSGPAYLWNRAASDGAVRSFDEAYEAVHAELAGLAGGGASAGIFAAHLEMLEDPMLRETVEANVAAGMSDAEALEAARDSICAMFSDIDDEYLRARADDVRDVFRRLLDAVRGVDKERGVPFGGQLSRSRQVLRLAEDAGCENGRGPQRAQRADTTGAARPVIVAEELFPSDAAEIDLSQVAGVLCARGSSTSHFCIIAHSMGVPIQLGADISGIRDGDMVEVDDPMVGEMAQIAAQVRAAGRKVYVNAGNLDDIRAAISAGADGIGVFRTEFLFMAHASMPTREEQRALYLEALLACAGKPLTIRLLDIGGDKALPYLPMPREDNPFLGVRGVRVGLAHPELYEAQLGAIADAACELRKRHPDWFADGTPVRIMIPMVCSVVEVLQVRQFLNTAAGEDAPVSIGIMVETPASVFNAADLAAECDFFSLGTNDLTQYIMAADRGNSAVASLYDALSPAVRSAIELTVAAAHAAIRPGCPDGISVSICGELASDPRASAFLLSAGLDSLSLSHL